jgi:hypothetical protein
MAATTRTELSVEIIYRISEFLNAEIRQHGETQKDNPRIWHGFLHKMDNSVWRGVLETLALLSKQHPELFKIEHLTAIDEGLTLLDKYEDYYDRVLDMKNRHVDAKRVAWKCLMTTREVYCAACDIYLPNKDSSRVLTTFGEIFQ